MGDGASPEVGGSSTSPAAPDSEGGGLALFGEPVLSEGNVSFGDGGGCARARRGQVFGDGDESKVLCWDSPS
jgi:hypothetical protein